VRALRQAQRRRRTAQIAEHRPPPSYLLLTRTALRNESPEFRTALLTRSARTAADIGAMADWEAEGRALAIFPPASVPPVGRLTTDSVLLEAALESGREAVNILFAEEADGAERAEAPQGADGTGGTQGGKEADGAGSAGMVGRAEGTLGAEGAG